MHVMPLLLPLAPVLVVSGQARHPGNINTSNATVRSVQAVIHVCAPASRVIISAMMSAMMMETVTLTLEPVVGPRLVLWLKYNSVLVNLCPTRIVM